MTSLESTVPASAPSFRFSVSSLVGLCADLLEAAGLPADRAQVVAEVLVEGDLMGHSTHGLQLLSRYLEGIAGGAIAVEGEPVVVGDRDSSLTWDGNWLPGPWLVRRAMDEAFARIARHPVVTIVIRRSGHIGCLAAYPGQAAERGLMMLLTSSDPAVRIVAPHGAVEPRYTPNPIAAGWPTNAEPVIVDTCPAMTTAGMVGRAARAGERMPGDWLIDAEGRASDDPSVLQGERAGAILPLGGLDLGHKGFALGLIVEALTSALGGFGRADGVTQDGAAVFMQVIDPVAFAGIAPFRREASWLAQSCRTAKPRPGTAPVRMPGERGLGLRAAQLSNGIALHPDTLAGLEILTRRYGMRMPEPIGDRPC